MLVPVRENFSFCLFLFLAENCLGQARPCPGVVTQQNSREKLVAFGVENLQQNVCRLSQIQSSVLGVMHQSSTERVAALGVENLQCSVCRLFQTQVRETGFCPGQVPEAWGQIISQVP